jgi:hypothetical protein
MDILWDDEKSRTIFENAASFVRKIAAGNMHRDIIRTEPFTESFTDAISNSKLGK